MKKGFTIVEVSILFVIFLIVAFLVAPMSLDDTRQAKNTSRWRSVQQDFMNIFYSINNEENETSTPFDQAIRAILENEIKESIADYKITYMNGTFPSNTFKFKDYWVIMPYYTTKPNNIYSKLYCIIRSRITQPKIRK